MPPSILVFTLDCLREATTTPSLAPFLCDAPLRWDRCYSSGTWTLPAHASLYSGSSPANHNVTRPGDYLSEVDARLPQAAEKAGYHTTIFSENPTFGEHYGFGNHVDSVHTDIHTKLLKSTFSPYRAVESISPSAAVSLAGDIARKPNRITNTINAFYTAYGEIYDPTPRYAHHGERVISHLSSALAEHDNSPTLAITNVLDTHNPYHGTPPGKSEPRDERELEALRAGDDNREFLLTENQPPDIVQSVYGNWEAFFEAQKQVYEEHVEEVNRLLTNWKQSQPDIFTESLVVLVGDHGQMFGAEQMVGHHTSLHPHGINVPLAIYPPSDWKMPDRTISEPVSLAGVGGALMSVCSSDVKSTDELIQAIGTESRTSNGRVITCVDGPTWSMTGLRDDERFDNSLIADLAVRKVASIQGDTTFVYESGWEDNNIKVTEFAYTETGREGRSQSSSASLPDNLETWLRDGPAGHSEERDSLSGQLEALGYM